MPEVITENRVDAAVEQANQWVERAEPIIRAYFGLDDINSDLLRKVCESRVNYRDTPLSRTYETPRYEVEKLMDRFHQTIEGIRADFICDVYFDTLCGCSVEQQERNQIDNSEVERRVASVKLAIGIVTDKVNAESAR